MNFYLSYGAGVGSEALRLWLLENNWPHEAVYIDHGCDWPETKEFVKTISNLTIIKPNVEGFDNLFDYCWHWKITPIIQGKRLCSHKFKVKPLLNYFKHPAIVYIGYTADEAKRIKINTEEDIFNQYPLVSKYWRRSDAEVYIELGNKTVPPRSHCWFCPLQSKGEWKLLYKKHPNLYQKAKELEQRSIKSNNKNASLAFGNKKLEDIVQEKQFELF